jgi:hypothetical protein
MLVRDNEKTIRRAIESLPDGSKLVVGDLGSSDSSIAICLEKGAEVIPISLDGDYSKARNSLIRDGFNMYLDPWEFVMSGRDLIPGLDRNSSFYVLESGILTKQTRLWSSVRFQNPAFETLVTDSECEPGVVIGSSGGPDLRSERLAICKKWIERRPTSPEPYYYTAFCCLSLGMRKEFCGHARRYLSMRTDADTSSVMLRYSLARAELAAGEFDLAYNNALVCLSLRPAFAEFWCLLGDILYSRKQYVRSEEIYKNAMMIGKRRKKSDDGPMDIGKYAEYPSMMIDNIRKIKSIIAEAQKEK